MATFSVNVPRGTFKPSSKVTKFSNLREVPVTNCQPKSVHVPMQVTKILQFKFEIQSSLNIMFFSSSLNKATLQLKEKQHCRKTIPLCFQEKQHRKKCLLPDEGQDEGDCYKDKNKNNEKNKKIFADPFTFYLSSLCVCESQAFVSHFLFSFSVSNFWPSVVTFF